MYTSSQNEAFAFDPIKFGFEPISLFPELEFNFPIVSNYWVKIIVYSNSEDLVYWYLVINEREIDDQFKIFEGSYDFKKPSQWGIQSSPDCVYWGLISSERYAKDLITHLLGTSLNKSVLTTAVKRFSDHLGPEMRIEFPQYYSNNQI
jgi:hypothetical protein